ncbi:MAG: hypothetical protein NXI09_08610 [Bacteroidetes bacterium]|nr:hypothetical protein [Bacteroidota bacterium]
MSRVPKSAHTPKQVAQYLKDQIAVRGERGLKNAFAAQFFSHFTADELEDLSSSFQRELQNRSEAEIAHLRNMLEAKSGKTVELRD